MKKSIWIFLFAVLLPGFVLGWLALRSAEEQQIIFERRTAELYQKETESLAASAREVVEAERRAFGDTVHRLLARSDAEALARDFTNSLMDAWPRKAVGFVLGPDGEMLSPTTTMASKNAELRDFLWNNGSFLCSTQPAVVYPVPMETNAKGVAYNQAFKSRAVTPPEGKPALSVSNGPNPTVLAQKGQRQIEQQRVENTRFIKEPIPADEYGSLTARGRIMPEQRAEMRPQVGQLPAQQAGAQGLAIAPQPPAPSAAAPQEAKSLNAAKDATELSIAPSAPLPMPDAPAAPAAAATPSAEMAPAPTAQPRPAAVRAPSSRATQMDVLTKELLREAPKRPASAAPSATKPDLAPRPLELSDRAKALGSATPAEASAAVADPHPEPQAGAGREKMDGQQVRQFETETLSLAKKTSPAVPATPADEASAVPPGLAGGILNEPATRGGAQATNGEQQLAAAGRLRGMTPAESNGLADLRSAAQTPDLPANAQQESVLNASPDQSIAMFGRYPQDALNRLVEPQLQVKSAVSNWSAILPATADFRALTAGNDEGMLARFVQDKLDLVFWIRPPEAPEMVFGCLIEAADLGELWKEVFASRIEENRGERPAFVLALLDDRARPVATFPATETSRDWKRPFVANEIGEVLPHWEAALYLATPTAMADTARSLRRTLSFTIAGAIALIAIGGWLVVHDVRRQLALAQQKTDFVSNVSHELKTPLTSIRMFAELMHDRPPAAEKQGQYLRIIQVEAERLTRLINNVLDFAKLERRQKRFDKNPLDLCGVITRVWEGQEMHLRDAGFTTRWQAAPGPYPVLGDEDALAQILVNLLSNAEKYSQERKDIELVTWLEGEWVNASILDRGIGVPDGEERKIFEAFYRAHDSLSSGIQGSGLGLTLAQRVAREHGGEILYERRQDGGSRFTLRLPLVHDREGHPAPEGNQIAGPSTS